MILIRIIDFTNRGKGAILTPYHLRGSDPVQKIQRRSRHKGVYHDGSAKFCSAESGLLCCVSGSIYGLYLPYHKSIAKWEPVSVFALWQKRLRPFGMGPLFYIQNLV